MKLKIRTEFYIILASACFLLDHRWVLSWILAAFVHEAFHYIAIRLCGQDVFCVQIGIWGARMTTAPMSGGVEIVCALAGPTGGLLCVLLAEAFPQLAVCAFIQSVFNLLPVYPLDGGRALRSLLGLLLPPSYIWVRRLIERAMSILLMSVAMYCTVFLKLGYIPVAAAAAIALKGKIKIPCKLPPERVQ